MALFRLLLLLSPCAWVTQVQGHPTPALPVPDGPQAGHCDTVRIMLLSLQAARSEMGDTCQGVQASGEDKYNALGLISYFLLYRPEYF